MKRLCAVLVLCLVSAVAFAQSMGIRFNDQKGREFVVYAPSGQFSYSMFEGDYISRDYNGRVTCVGNTYISYNVNGKVSRIDDIYISYDVNGRVNRVGGLFIQYDINGNISHTQGNVRSNSGPYIYGY